jgi:WD40 repeat protein
LWNAVTGEPRGSIPVPSIGANDLAFSPEGTILSIAGEDGVATLWDVASMRMLGKSESQGGPLLSLAFSSDGRVLATGGFEGIVRLWDMGMVLGARGISHSPSSITPGKLSPAIPEGETKL